MFSTIVHNGNTNRSKSESSVTLQKLDTSVSVLTVTEDLIGEETRIVVVIDEGGKNRDINVLLSPGVVVVSNSPHILLVNEKISHVEIPRIVQN